MKNALLLLFVLLQIAFVATAHSAQRREILVAAAVSLKEAFQEIGRAFETRSGHTVRFTFDASGVLQKQIENGAPVDVFASAGARQMDVLDGQNLMDRETRRNFARNALIIIAPAGTRLAS